MCDLGTLLQRISKLLEAVQDIFATIMEVAGDILDKLREWFMDGVEQLSSALGLDSALAGIYELFEGICACVAELCDISAILSPVMDAWQSADWFSAGSFGVQHYDEVRPPPGTAENRHRGLRAFQEALHR